jgi:TatA/E family protein of Tat protein translocase
MGTLGWQEIMFVFFLALVLFGPKELPKIGRTLGKALTEFRRASSDLKATFDRELSSLERESQSVNEAVGSLSDPADSSYKYNYGYDSYYDAAATPAPIESTATEPSTVSASAPQGAEPAKIAAPEGTVPATGESGPPHPAPAEPASGPPHPAPAEPAGGPPSAAS